MTVKDDVPQENGIPLGKRTSYGFDYDPSVLFPIARSEGRRLLGIGEKLPFCGGDLWTAYEFSWLGLTGLPEVAIIEFEFPCESPSLVESKSFKLYLNSFNQSRFKNSEQILETLHADLARVCGAAVRIRLFPVTGYSCRTQMPLQAGYRLIDDPAVACGHYLPDPGLLSCRGGEVEQKLCSYRFRSLCPVTGQPDWASFYIHYRGRQICEKSLLQYLVSFRSHAGFHEQCVEQVFVDLMRQCAPASLMVYARFLRRGGLDINPLRSTEVVSFPPLGDPRQ